MNLFSSLIRSPEQPQVSSCWEGVTSGINARRYSFKLCAAMLSSKQLLWHFLKAALSAGFPIFTRLKGGFPEIGYCRVAVGLKRLLPPSIR
ncbi:MAG: hypothetical protein V7K89_12190 [Nostoc sp.]|uniref:hypothetical protein n=1 Tax=Nostoc sp. TaxID=1180 RepID=UPI002FF8EFC6